MNPAESSSMGQEASDGRPGPGQMLRAAREAKGMHLAMLSVALKVPIRKLEALERDDHSAFQDVTFLRALAKAVCRHLDMDATPVMAALPQPVSNLPTQSPGLERPMNPSAQSAWYRKADFLPSRSVFWVALLMIVSIASLIWWPDIHDALSSSQAVSAPAGQTDEPIRPAGPLQEDLPVPSVTVPAPASVESSGLILNVKQPTWIEVRDGTGQILVKRQVQAGETLRPQVDAPLFVFISQADSTELIWQGRTLDLLPHTQDNQVRLRIKP